MAATRNDCEACGKSLPPKPVIYKKARFCSPKCMEQYRKRQVGKKARPCDS
jgi:hypothetical protein